MKDLEKAMMKQYKYQQQGHSTKRLDLELATLQDWAENLILRQDGKLTISSENEIQHVLDKLRIH
jgi:hypothetical protein